MTTLEKRVEKLEAVTTRTQKRALPDRDEYERRGRWMADTINAVCEPCPERFDDGSGLIMDTHLMCSCGTSPLKCKTVGAGLQTRANNETDEDAKRDLLKLRAWVSA